MPNIDAKTARAIGDMPSNILSMLLVTFMACGCLWIFERKLDRSIAANEKVADAMQKIAESDSAEIEVFRE